MSIEQERLERHRTVFNAVDISQLEDDDNDDIFDDSKILKKEIPDDDNKEEEKTKQMINIDWIKKEPPEPDEGSHEQSNGNEEENAVSAKKSVTKSTEGPRRVKRIRSRRLQNKRRRIEKQQQVIKNHNTRSKSVRSVLEGKPCSSDSMKPSTNSLVCDRKSSTSSHLEEHLQKRTSSSESKVLVDNTNKPSLKRQKPTTPCNICGKDVAASHIKRHIRLHATPKALQCDMCELSFHYFSELKIHKFSHTGEKPFPCTICDKRFSRNQNLKDHLLVHTGKRDFSCTICGKAFKRSSVLVRHQTVHLNEKPYVCNICGKKFSRSRNLSSHSIIHSQEKAYKCDMCDTVLYSRDGLRQHKLRHTLPYGCPKCRKRVLTKSLLMEHIHTHARK